MEFEDKQDEKMEVMVLTGLVAICKNLAKNSRVPEELQVKARKFVERYDSLVPDRGRNTTAQHAQGEELLIEIARFLPSVLEVDERKEPEEDQVA